MGSASPEHGARALDALDQAGILHALIGGMAANIYRRNFRVTGDFDFLVNTFDGLQETLEAAGFEVVTGTHGTQDEWLVRAEVDNIGFDFALAEIEVQETALMNAQANAGVVTVEDLVVLKLIANRSQDIDDLTNIVKSGRTMDIEYVRDWCAKLNEHFETAPRFRRFQDLYIEQHHSLDGPKHDGPSIGIN